MNPVDLYVFSGTGNTWLAANRVCEVLTREGPGARLKLLEHSVPENIDTSRTLGIAFPIACFATYPLVTDFLNRLPAGNGCAVFLLTTMAGNSGNYPGRLRGLFQQKGYTLLGATEVIMPDNIFGKGELSEKQQSLLDIGKAAAATFAHSLLAGEGVWPEESSSLLARLSAGVFRWRFGQHFRPQVRRQLCTGCGLCVRLCPAKNIRQEGDQVRIEPHCQYCLRCRGLCPAGAIRTFFSRPYHSVDWTEIPHD